MSDLETRIDERAVVDPGAELDHGVQIGPFAVVGPGVRIGSGTVVGPHAVVEGKTTIGRDNRIFQFATVGTVPQDLKYAGEDSELIIGDRNRIRECATLHIGTEEGGMITRVGSDNLIMAYCHVAHDCIVGDGVILANAATLGGHVVVEDRAVIMGMAGVHQFCRVGTMAMVAAAALVVKDVPPYTAVQGDRARLVGLNTEGLRRKGVTGESLAHLKTAYRILFRSNLVQEEAIRAVRREVPSCREVDHLLGFLESSERGVTR